MLRTADLAARIIKSDYRSSRDDEPDRFIAGFNAWLNTQFSATGDEDICRWLVNVVMMFSLLVAAGTFNLP